MSRVSVGLRNCAAALLMSAAALTTAIPAWAQAVQMTVSQTVVPAGSPVEVTLTGPPGQFFAVGGSTTGSGLTYGGVQLQLGVDAVVLAQGVIDGTGRVVVAVTPPFRGSVIESVLHRRRCRDDFLLSTPERVARGDRQERRPARRRDRSRRASGA